MMDPLATEKTYLREHLDELASAHPGKFLLIKGDQVHGAFETYKQGVIEGARQFGAGPFLVRSVLQPNDPEPLNIPTLTTGISIISCS